MVLETIPETMGMASSQRSAEPPWVSSRVKYSLPSSATFSSIDLNRSPSTTDVTVRSSRFTVAISAACWARNRASVTVVST